MAEMWDIARYVEDHPEDFEQRWRLAKKLYMAWEYRLALEHLQVLKNEWQKRVNVVRYLAATYYRLGRYDEAITELEEAVREWPQEIGLHEQLARVLEIAGRRKEAAEAWENIAKIDSQHPIASTAAKRLHERLEDESPVHDLRLEDSDSGIDLSPGTVCPNCGAQNSNEFDRCWQCHAALFTPRGPQNTPRHDDTPGAPVVSAETMLLAVGTAALALLALALFLSLRLVFASQDNEVLTTFSDVYNSELTFTRVLSVLSMIILGPVSLFTALMLVKGNQEPPSGLILFSGLLVGGVAAVASWLPGSLWFLVLVLPALASLLAVLVVLRLVPGRGLAVWGMQQAIVVVAMSALVILTERIQLGEFYNPFVEIPALLRYTAQESETGTRSFAAGELPLVHGITWKSTGSPWLDRRAGATKFTVHVDKLLDDLYFEIKDASGTKAYEPVKGTEWSYNFLVEPGQRYTITVGTPHQSEGTASLDVAGLLIPE